MKGKLTAMPVANCNRAASPAHLKSRKRYGATGRVPGPSCSRGPSRAYAQMWLLVFGVILLAEELYETGAIALVLRAGRHQNARAG